MRDGWWSLWWDYTLVDLYPVTCLLGNYQRRMWIYRHCFRNIFNCIVLRCKKSLFTNLQKQKWVYLEQVLRCGLNNWQPSDLNSWLKLFMMRSRGVFMFAKFYTEKGHDLWWEERVINWPEGSIPHRRASSMPNETYIIKNTMFKV